jgi:hypothetical protein
VDAVYDEYGRLPCREKQAQRKHVRDERGVANEHAQADPAPPLTGEWPCQCMPSQLAGPRSSDLPASKVVTATP